MPETGGTTPPHSLSPTIGTEGNDKNYRTNNKRRNASRAIAEPRCIQALCWGVRRGCLSHKEAVKEGTSEASTAATVLIYKTKYRRIRAT